MTSAERGAPGEGEAGGRTRPWRELRARLAAAGFRPSRARGQNFLLDENCLRAIVRDAGVRAGELVLEVGAGCGVLSRHLARAGARLVAVEIDRRLAAVAREELAAEEGWELLEIDVLAGKHALAPALVERLPTAEPWKLVSNLPYSVAGPVLALVARLPNPPASATVLVQRELAERIASAPGSRAWGPLAARLAVLYRRRLGRAVPPRLFWPRPRVESALCHLELRDERPGEAELARYDELCGGLFRHRRKTLRRVLADRRSAAEASALLERLGLDPARRAESLEVSELLALAAASAAGDLGAR